MKMIKYLILIICLAARLSVGYADSVTINPANVGGQTYWDYAAAGTNIGVLGTGAIGHNLAGFVDYDASWGTEYEWRVSVGFDVQPIVLGFNPGDVVSATLKFNTVGWLHPERNMVTVDQTQSYLVGMDPWDFMYGYHWATIVANGESTSDYSVDITAAFVTAMTNAVPASGISFVWNADNDADVDLGSGFVSPYNGSGDVIYNTGYNVYNARIEVVYQTRPTGCGDEGTIYLAGDLNKDCKIDFADFALMAAAGWMDCTTPGDSTCSGWYNQ